jgi:hypothetical protein
MPPSLLSRIASYARGTDCGAHIVDWRNRLLPLAGGILLLVGGELVLRSFAERACHVCLGGDFAVHVEDRPFVSNDNGRAR